MKISVSTSGLCPAKIEDVLNFVSNEGLKYLEVVKEYPYHDLKADDFSSHDIKLSVHAPISDVNIASHIDKIREASIEEMKDAFIKANEWNADRVVVHPGSIPNMGLNFMDKILEYDDESLIRCQSLAEEYGVMMCVENMPLQDKLLYSNIEALFDFVSNKLHSGITLDVGHAHTNSFSVDEMFESDDIHHVHLSDNDGSWDTHSALGTKDIDFKRVFEVLEKKKYDEICVIEVKSVPGIRRSIDYLRNINVL